MSKLIIGLAIAFALGATPALADPYADLAKYGAAFAAVHSYRTTMQLPNGMSIATEVVAPGKTHVTMSGPRAMEMIHIGTDTWVKPNGQWMHLPDEQAQNMAGRFKRSAPPSGDFKKDFTVVDLGMKDGLHAYQLGSAADSTVTVLYLRPDWLPAKQEMTRDGQTTTITYSDFNATITIDPPM